MARTYILKAAASTLPAGADFTRDLSANTEAAGTITIATAKAISEDSFGYTVAGEPNFAGALIGDYTVEINVTTANVNVFLLIAVSRVDSAGAQQTISVFTAEQEATAAVHIFSLAAIDLGTWLATDRLKVVYRHRNAHAMTAQSIAIETGTVSAEVVAPFAVPVFSGTVASAQPAQISSASAQQIFEGPTASAQPAGSSAGVSTLTFSGGGASTQPAGSSAVIGEEVFQGGITSTQPAGASAGVGEVITPITGVVASIQEVQRTAAVGAETFSGAVVSAQPAPASAAVGEEVFSGPTASLQPASASAGSGAQVFTSMVASTQPAGASAGVGTETFTGAIASTQTVQISTGVATQTFAGGVTSTQEVQRSSGVGNTPVGGFTGLIISLQATQYSRVRGWVGAYPTLPPGISFAGIDQGRFSVGYEAGSSGPSIEPGKIGRE